MINSFHRINTIRLFLPLLIFGISSSCEIFEKKGDEVEPIFVITGTIVNARSTSKNPIQNTSVSLSGAESRTTVTGSDGNYRFDDVKTGSYIISASHDDFEGNSTAVTVEKNEISRGDLSLTPKPPFNFSPSVVDFGASINQKDVTISNIVSSAIIYEIQLTASWLTVNKTSGNLGAQNTDLLALTVDRSKVAIGNHTTSIVINTPDRGSQNIQVLLSKLDASSGVLEIDKQSLDFGNELQDQKVVLSNTGAKTLDWSLSVDVDWLSSNKVSGSIAPGLTEELIIFASRGGLANGTYSANLSFSGNGGTATVPVSMTVTDGGENQAVLSINQTALDFGSQETTRSITITNTGNRELEWILSSNKAWLTSSSNTGKVNPGSSQDINILVSRAGLEDGNQTGLVTLGGNGGTKTITVTMNVPDIDAAVLAVSTNSLDFGLEEENKTITLSNSGNIALNWTISDNQDWLSVSNTSGTIQAGGATDIFVYVSRTGQNNGDYSGNVTVGGNGGSKTISIAMSVIGGANDLDGDGFPDDIDADDDNNGLIEIHNINDLYAIRNDLTATGAGKQGAPAGGFTGYELTKDLDFSNNADYSDVSLKPEVSAGAGWTPIGNSSGNYFATTFEGNNHVIRNLLLDRVADYQGLFGRINILATIQNLSLEIKYFSAEDYTGGLAGLIYRGKVINCHVSGNLSGKIAIGLLSGYNQGGTVEGCSAKGGVSSTAYTVGGLVGSNYSYYTEDGISTITNSFAEVTVKGGENSGGLVGYNASGDVISFCYSLGNITSNYYYAGGLAGYNAGQINSCYSKGSVSSSSSYVGGLVGYNSGGSIITSFSTGILSGNSSIGGLIGYKSSGGSVSSTNYWDITTSGVATTSGNAGTGLTSSELKSPTSATGIYITWNADVWDFGNASQYPALKNMPEGLENQR